MQPATQVAIFLCVACCVVGGLSSGVGDMIMGLLGTIIVLVSRDFQSNICSSREAILAQLPTTFKSALSHFNLNGRTTTFAACPDCHCTYGPTVDICLSQPVYPEHCSNIPRPGQDICGARLLHPRDSADSPYKPLKPFVYQHFHDYVAGLLTQPEIEAAMDRTCDEFSQA